MASTDDLQLSRRQRLTLGGGALVQLAAFGLAAWINGAVVPLVVAVPISLFLLALALDVPVAVRIARRAQTREAAKEAAAQAVRDEEAAVRRTRPVMPGEVAIDDPTVSDALARARRRAWLMLVGGLAGLTAAVVGISVFTDPSPAPRSEHLIELGADEVPEEDSSPADMLLAIVVVTALCALVAGMGTLGRVRRQRRVLRRFPWTCVPARFGSIPVLGMHGSGNPSVMIGPNGQERLVVVVTSFKWSPDRAGLASATEVELAGPTDRYAVLRAPGSDRLVSVRPPRRHRSEDRWHEVFRPRTPPS